MPGTDPAGTAGGSAPIEAVLFDMNGTLRQRLPDPEWQARSVSRLLQLLGMKQAPEGFPEELHQRYKAYTAWADKTGACLPEAEAWREWIDPGAPANLDPALAEELVVTLRNCRGRTVLKAGARELLDGLSGRGYRLGVISNTPSRRDLPVFIEENGLTELFDVVVLSSLCGARKPAPAIFHLATEQLGLPASACAYVGNKVSKDIAGAHAAGFGQVVLIAAPGSRELEAVEQASRPDRIVSSLIDLLELFPGRV